MIVWHEKNHLSTPLIRHQLNETHSNIRTNYSSNNNNNNNNNNITKENDSSKLAKENQDIDQTFDSIMNTIEKWNNDSLSSSLKESKEKLYPETIKTGFDLLTHYLPSNLLAFNLKKNTPESSSLDLASQSTIMRYTRLLLRHDMRFGFVMSPGRCATKYLAYVLGGYPEKQDSDLNDHPTDSSSPKNNHNNNITRVNTHLDNEKQMEMDLLSRCLVVHEDYAEQVNVIIKPALYANDLTLVRKYLSSVIIPGILIRMLIHKTLCYVDTGHQYSLGYMNVMSELLGMHRIKIVHLTRNRLRNAASFSGDTHKLPDLCSYQPTQPSLHYCPLTFPSTFHSVSPLVWGSFNSFQRYLWWVDEVHAKWTHEKLHVIPDLFSQLYRHHFDAVVNQSLHLSLTSLMFPHSYRFLPSPLYSNHSVHPNLIHFLSSSSSSSFITLNFTNYSSLFLQSMMMDISFDLILNEKHLLDISLFFGVKINPHYLSTTTKINHHNFHPFNLNEYRTYATIYESLTNSRDHHT